MALAGLGLKVPQTTYLVTALKDDNLKACRVSGAYIRSGATSCSCWTMAKPALPAPMTATRCFIGSARNELASHSDLR